MIGRRVVHIAPPRRRGVWWWPLRAAGWVVSLVLGLVVRLGAWRWRGIPVGAAVVVFVAVQMLRQGGL